MSRISIHIVITTYYYLLWMTCMLLSSFAFKTFTLRNDNFNTFKILNKNEN